MKLTKEQVSQISYVCENGSYDKCKHCGERSDYSPNPFYHHECEHCGTKGYYKDILEDVSVKEQLEMILGE